MTIVSAANPSDRIEGNTYVHNLLLRCYNIHILLSLFYQLLLFTFAPRVLRRFRWFVEILSILFVPSFTLQLVVIWFNATILAPVKHCIVRNPLVDEPEIKIYTFLDPVRKNHPNLNDDDARAELIDGGNKIKFREQKKKEEQNRTKNTRLSGWY